MTRIRERARRARTTISVSGSCRRHAGIAWRGFRRCSAFAFQTVHAAMEARQRLGIIRAQPGVGPITALSVAVRVAKQRFDLLDPLLILAHPRRRSGGAFLQCKVVEPLVRLECCLL